MEQPKDDLPITAFSAPHQLVIPSPVAASIFTSRVRSYCWHDAARTYWDQVNLDAPEELSTDGVMFNKADAPEELSTDGVMLNKAGLAWTIWLSFIA